MPTLWLLFGFACTSPAVKDCTPIYREYALETAEKCNARLKAYADLMQREGKYGQAACVEIHLPAKDA